jgi:hypothetical protein
MVYVRGLQPAARGPDVALATILCGPSHDLGISQCGKGKESVLLRNIVLILYTLSRRKGKQSKEIF